MHFLSLVFLCHHPFINMPFIGNSTETVRRGKHLLRGQHPNIMFTKFSQGWSVRNLVLTQSRES